MKHLISLIENELHDAVLEVRGSNIIIMKSGAMYFIKYGKPSKSYKCEFNGLIELRRCAAIEVVKPILFGKEFIVTELIQSNNQASDFFEKLGMGIAQLHKIKGRRFGFYEDNFIGSTPQINSCTELEANDWGSFYYNKRLLFQYELALKQGVKSKRLKEGFLKLENSIGDIFQNSIEQPTLLHGDLWAGNYLCNEKGNPILIDPAVYYGHREADIAMTLLFGGFPEQFYKSYNQVYPLQEGWKARIAIYQLYHVLNHFNMFGCGYLNEAEQLISHYM